MHQGVGLLIQNERNDLFFIQQKDEKYSQKKWIGAYSFWGGEIENGDLTIYDALLRELNEEILTSIDFLKHDFNFIGKYTVNSDEVYLFNLYLLTLNEFQFLELCNAEIKEGNGVVINQNELINGNWVWGLEQVIKNYFEIN